MKTVWKSSIHSIVQTPTTLVWDLSAKIKSPTRGDPPLVWDLSKGFVQENSNPLLGGTPPSLGFSACMYYSYSTCMYCSYSTCMYCSYSTCMYYTCKVSYQGVQGAEPPGFAGGAGAARPRFANLQLGGGPP